ncbi:MAG: xanthine dehydrogenase family protein molybdopterin-binding subunit, partial [Deltaproteobacteria bacterium]|nr:xanthine dehydrogenase family protein molybdopterin-binding subunit [Deltaproteobacteria bacterium]
HDRYRPACAISFAGGIDADGKISSLVIKSAGSAIFKFFYRNFSAAAGFADMFYDIPNVSARNVISEKLNVPVGTWRSPGLNQNIFFIESFIDELAYAAGLDPVEFRKAHLGTQPRHLQVLEKVAEMADWGNPAVAGAAHGIAIHQAHGSVFAQVAEVSVINGSVTVHKVYCAVDCGQVVNPDIVKAQMEGGIIFGLTAALYGEITLDRGRVAQSNFHNYPMVSMRDAPEVETAIIASGAAPGGVGEGGVPPVFPAVTNAVYAATGQRIRKLPLSLHDFS